MSHHQSHISHNSRGSETNRYRSISKQNFISSRKQTPIKIKEDVYLNKLVELEKRYMNEISKNNKKIKDLEERSTIYKNISNKQGIKLHTCETTLAKEEYLIQIMNYKDGVNRVQQLLTAVTEEHQSKMVEFHKDIELQNEKWSMNSQKIAQLERQIQYNEQILNNNRIKMKKSRDQIDKNSKTILQKYSQQKKYLQIMNKINKTQSKQ